MRPPTTLPRLTSPQVRPPLTTERRIGPGASVIAALVFLAAFAAPSLAEPSVITAGVTGMSSLEPVVAIGAGRAQGLALGDRVAIVEAANPTKIVGTGEAYILDTAKAVVRLAERPASGRPQTRPSAGAVAGWRAIVVPASFIARAKEAMPPETTISAVAAGVGPGRRQVWIDAGRLSGLVEDDTVWIRREDFPIARGRVVLVLERTALVQPRPLVTNAVPDVDDAVELWPSPAARRLGRPESVVMEVTPDADGWMLKLAGARRDGFVAERQMELLNGNEYVGLAGVVTSSDRLCLAKSLRAFCATQPSVGLRAVGRPVASRPSVRLSARIFDVREGFVLISAGGADGVQLGQHFVVIRDGMVVARLEVQTVEVDFAGAEPRPAAPGEAVPELKKWDVVVREPVPPDPVQRAGTVGAVRRTGEWLTGTVTGAETGIEPGAVVRIAAESPVAAIVAGIAGPQVLLYIPPGWGRATILPGQAIERVTE